MDKIKDHQFLLMSTTIRSDRRIYCFDKCVNSFDTSVTSEQYQCLSKRALT
jgi:hypothetical protein